MFTFLIRYFFNSTLDPFTTAAVTVNAFWGNTNKLINALWGFSMTPTELLTQDLGSIRNDVSTSILFTLAGDDIDPDATVYFKLSFLSMDKAFFTTTCPRAGPNYQVYIPPNINPKMPSARANFSLFWDDVNGPKVLAAGTLAIEQWVQN